MKDRTTSIVTAVVMLLILAFVLIPVLRVLVLGYRWALS